MFLSRNKTEERLELNDSEMTPGMKDKLDTLVSGWGQVKRGVRDAHPGESDAPLKVIRKADVDYLLSALDAEANRIEAEMAQTLADRKLQHQAEIAKKDAEIAAINREIEERKAQIAAQEQDVWRRTAEIRKAADIAARIFPAFDASGYVHASDVRKDVVRRRFGDAAVDGKSEAYIDDRFDVLAERANVDPFALVVSDGIQRNDPRSEADRAYEKMVQSLRDSHKDQTKH